MWLASWGRERKREEAVRTRQSDGETTATVSLTWVSEGLVVWYIEIHEHRGSHNNETREAVIIMMAIGDHAAEILTKAYYHCTLSLVSSYLVILSGKMRN